MRCGSCRSSPAQEAGPAAHTGASAAAFRTAPISAAAAWGLRPVGGPRGALLALAQPQGQRGPSADSGPQPPLLGEATDGRLNARQRVRGRIGSSWSQEAEQAACDFLPDQRVTLVRTKPADCGACRSPLDPQDVLDGLGDRVSAPTTGLPKTGTTPA